MEKRGTSNAPLILGIIGAIVSLPNLICASACASLAGTVDTGAGAGIFIVGILPVIAGFVSAFYGKSKPEFCGIGMIVAAVATFIFLIWTGFSGIFAWAALILFVIAAIIAFVQERE